VVWDHIRSKRKDDSFDFTLQSNIRMGEIVQDSEKRKTKPLKRDNFGRIKGRIIGRKGRNPIKEPGSKD